MTSRALDPTPFIEHRQTLVDPDAEIVRDAFARLPKRGTIEVLCRWESRAETLRTLEHMGAFAIYIRPQEGFGQVRITALKGKSGACHETGRSATYTGAALAAMDDDQHLIVGTIRVCEKTGGLYTLPPYHGLLTVTSGDEDMIRRLETDPLPFDCGTFESDADSLARRDLVSTSLSEPFMAVFYPGPFKLLVLRDGTVLRRGRCTRISARLGKDLEKRDGVLLLPPPRMGEAEQPMHYPTAYRELGVGCLPDGIVVAAEVPCPTATDDFDSTLTEQAKNELKTSPREIRRRLSRLIESEELYFILAGSDPSDTMGCCPSIQVGAANRLVEAGVLACYRTPAPRDACTTTIYAFAGEIRICEGQPEFHFSHSVRRQVSAVFALIERGQRRQTALKTGLLMLVGVSLVLAGRRAVLAFGGSGLVFGEAMVRTLGVARGDTRLFLCLFQGHDTCTACDSMGRFCRRTIEAHFAPQTEAGLLVFREVAYDAPDNRAIKRQLGLYTSTVGLVRYVHGKPKEIRLLTREAWTLWTDEEAFVRMLRENIQQMLAQEP